jgi:uncharacterized protein YegP (UPF0339 family)
MTERRPRFEVVHSDAGFHVRFRTSNGQILFTSEVYKRRRAAHRAILILAGRPALYFSKFQDWPEVDFGRHGLVEVRQVDERGRS